MKLTNLGLVFAGVFLSFVIADDCKTMLLSEIAHLQMTYNNALDNAVSDGMMGLVELDSGRERVVNKEEAIQRFFLSLGMNLGIHGEVLQERELWYYVPVIMIVLEDGFYVYYHELHEENGDKQIKGVFTDKIIYQDKWKEYIINYTLTDYVAIVNPITGQEMEGNYHDLYEYLPIELFSSEEVFQKERRKNIIHLLTDTMSYYMIEHNRIAKHFGLQYGLRFPTIEGEDWYRTIDDIGMIAIFQGYPYGNGKVGCFNKIAFSGGRLRKVEKGYEE